MAVSPFGHTHDRRNSIVTWCSLSLCRAPSFSVAVNLASKQDLRSKLGLWQHEQQLDLAVECYGSGLSVDLMVKLVVKEN